MRVTCSSNCGVRYGKSAQQDRNRANAGVHRGRNARLWVGCGGAASLLRVATDSMQNDPMQVNVVHSEEQVCISH